MPLICPVCIKTKKNIGSFYQISREYRNIPFRREIRQATNGIHPYDWSEAFGSSFDGIYCSECQSAILKDYMKPPEKELLRDNRLDLWEANEFPIQDVTAYLINTGERVGAGVETYHIPRREAAYGNLSIPLPTSLQNKLKNMGIDRLYTHQTEAINQIREGKNTVIVTGTASGKSMIYTLPILESLLGDKNATALYLSPLKALTRDQLEALSKWSDTNSDGTFGFQTLEIDGEKISAGILEGGAGDSVRDLTYENARIWMTNVHYLHYILRGPYHFPKKSELMKNYFKQLKFVVLDELHSYNGVMGSKVAMLMRRLRLLCKQLGNPDLQFIACSASIGNPKELAEEITGLKRDKGFVLIDKDGSPSHSRDIILWNPGKLNSQSSDRTRRAPVSDVIEILRGMIEKFGTLPKTIVFMGNRRASTATSFDLNRSLRPTIQSVTKKENLSNELIAPFHAQLAGPIKQQLMGKLKNGELVGLVTTSALEMGIDIGDLSLCIMIGYAGSKASFLQQAGRVGRTGPGIVIQLFQEDPLEQYYAANPTEFMERRPENVSIDSSNAKIVAENMIYATNECGGKIIAPHNYFKVSRARKISSLLEEMEEVKKGIWVLKNSIEQYNPLINSGKVYQVVHRQGLNTNILFEGVDERSQLRDYHHEAVFLHNQKTYRVQRILAQKGIIEAVPVNVDYTTISQINDSISILDDRRSIEYDNGISVFSGQLEITRRLWGYRKVKLLGSSVIGEVQSANAYPIKYQTDGLWIQFNNVIEKKINEGSIHVVEHAIAAAIPSLIKCSKSDFSMLSSVNMKEFSHRPVIILYETDGGGAGIVDMVIDRLIQVIKKALSILRACSCEDGCPNCTHLSFCERSNEPLDKKGGINLFEQLLME
jgi:DEAD/DEAH box helicase domain-containing protein